jgi:hypothetical protein
MAIAPQRAKLVLRRPGLERLCGKERTDQDGASHLTRPIEKLIQVMQRPVVFERTIASYIFMSGLVGILPPDGATVLFRSGIGIGFVGTGRVDQAYGLEVCCGLC